MKNRKALERFEEKYIPEPNSGCWLWLGTIATQGYGVFWNGKKTVKAHRHSYELYCAPIPAGLVLDHLCRNRACVNPQHLEPVTDRENIQRGESGKLHREKTHCSNGHPFNAANTYYYNKNNGRYCRVCDRLRQRSRRAQRLGIDNVGTAAA